jgi:CheY-like chemotaxis protein/two-component sensor histidine kinase
MPGGRVVWDGVQTDVTERRQIREALREEDRRKDEFLATLAHELRNPLAPLKTGLELLRLPGADPEIGGRARAMMERQLDHLVRLVDDLLEVSRIARGKIVLQPASIDLCEVVRAAVELSGPATATPRRLTLSLPDAPLLANGDRVRLVQALGNLLGNAVKFTREHGQIWLSAVRDGDRARISVRDDGEGIPRERLDGIFELFSQVHPARGGGLGIGLTLARALVALHGGCVEGRSAGPGQGSEFIVSLPLAEARVLPRPTDTPPPDPELAARRILVVDDNRDIADSLGLLLRTLGAEVRIVYDGATALQVFAAEHPDAVLLDIGLPDLDGCEVARRLRAQYPASPVILVAVTGWGDAQDRQRVQAAGFDHHLVKPASLERLKSVLAARKP